MKKFLEGFTGTKSRNPTVQDIGALQLLTKYEQYTEETINGVHGRTPQFYMRYISIINYFFLLNTSIRTADFELLKYVLPKITNLFFAFNQPNYAKFLVKYHDDLIKIDQTHPGLKEALEKGSFGVKRTDKSFSRQPVDVTLGQAINADAANRLTGILHFTNSIGARQRWCKNHSIRSTVIADVMDETGLKKKQDVTADLRASVIKKNTVQIEDFLRSIDDALNPNDSRLQHDLLYNISNSQTAPPHVADYLRSFETKGNEQREAFISEGAISKLCLQARFPRNKIHSFTETIKKTKIKVSGKVQEVRMQRDLFGRLLGVALEINIDIKKVLTYPLTPVPLSMCHIDGMICKTDKSTLLKCLENQLVTVDEADVDAVPSPNTVAIDGFFFLYLMKNVRMKFGDITKKMLYMAFEYPAQTVVIAFDRYFSPSIKDHEHILRNASTSDMFIISSAEQKRPSDFHGELKNIKFKEALVQFFIKNIAQQPTQLFGNRTVLLNYDVCYKYEVSNRRIERTIEEELSCAGHEEADIKIVFHVCQQQAPNNVFLRCSDTDILIIMLGNMEHVQNGINVFMEVGTGNS